MLGVCDGEMTMCAALGGAVEGGHNREFGRADIQIERASALLDGLGDIGDREPVWMSHGDVITAIPLGFEVVATSDGSPFAVIADEGRRLYGVQFHLRRWRNTPRGALILRNFTHKIAGLAGDWTMAALFATRRWPASALRWGRGQVICGLSGGVRLLGGGGGADTRGDWRSAHLCLRRHRTAAPERGVGGGDSVQRSLQYSPDPC